MRDHDELPISAYIHTAFALPQVQKIVENWRVDPEKVIDMLIEHFKDMGILRVPRGHQPILYQSLVHYLRFSPELQAMVSRTKQDEVRRQRTRHAE